eukprot:3937145-Rhodomonas_salina.1
MASQEGAVKRPSTQLKAQEYALAQGLPHYQHVLSVPLPDPYTAPVRIKDKPGTDCTEMAVECV